MAETGTYIVGDKTNNYVVFDSRSGVVYTFDLKANTYGLPRAVPAAPAVVQNAASKPQPKPTSSGVTGNANTGVVYFSGRSVSYLTDINNRQAKWKSLPDAPFDIKGICGDLLNGIVIHDGDNIAQIKDVFNNPVWLESAISPRIPIAGIAGDGTNGIVVYRRSVWENKNKYDSEDGKFVPTVYLFSGQPYSSPTSPLEPKIAIESIMGDGLNGYIAMGENQLFSLVKGVWAKLASLNFSLGSATGNAKDGVVALLGRESYVVTSTPDCKTWNLVQTIPDSTAAGSTGGHDSAAGGKGAQVGAAPASAGAQTAPASAPAEVSAA